MTVQIHPTAQVHAAAKIGAGTRILQNAAVHEGAEIGTNCVVGKDAEIEAARLGSGTKVWGHSQIRKDAQIGNECNIGQNVYVGAGVKIGDKCKIQNNVLVYEGVILEEGVFLGPACTTTNDLNPRAINPDGSLKTGGTVATDWTLSKTLIKKGASVGAKAVILPVIVGEFALVAAGAVVTKEVPAFGLVAGVPAKLIGYVCKCAKRLENECKLCGMKLADVKQVTL